MFEITFTCFLSFLKREILEFWSRIKISLSIYLG